MKIGILGSGAAGLALGSGLIRIGHAVMIGTRRPEQEKLQEWLHQHQKDGQLGTFAEAAAYGDVLILCTNCRERRLRLKWPVSGISKRK